MLRKIVFTTVFAAATFSLSPVANAQWIGNLKNARMKPARVHFESLGPRASQAAAEDLSDLSKQALVGTWLINIPATPGGEAFMAFQTFHGEGTLTENSSLLATLTEGPAQGIWRGKDGEYNSTFQLFAYEKGVPVGMIRVRTSMRVVLADALTADYVVDFVDFNGFVTEAIGQGTFSGRRVKLVKP